MDDSLTFGDIPKLIKKGKGYSIVEIDGEPKKFRELGLAEMEGRLSPSEVEAHLNYQLRNRNRGRR